MKRAGTRNIFFFLLGPIDSIKLNSHDNIVSHVAALMRNIRELKQPRRRRQQKPHKFAYLTMKNSIFARFPRAVFIF